MTSDTGSGTRPACAAAKDAEAATVGLQWPRRGRHGEGGVSKPGKRTEGIRNRKSRALSLPSSERPR